MTAALERSEDLAKRDRKTPLIPALANNAHRPSLLPRLAQSSLRGFNTWIALTVSGSL
jgi:hypothetical protein